MVDGVIKRRILLEEDQRRSHWSSGVARLTNSQTSAEVPSFFTMASVGRDAKQNWHYLCHLLPRSLCGIPSLRWTPFFATTGSTRFICANKSQSGSVVKARGQSLSGLRAELIQEVGHGQS